MDWVLPAVVGLVGGLAIIEWHDRRIPRAMRAAREGLREHCRLRKIALIQHEWSTPQYYAMWVWQLLKWAGVQVRDGVVYAYRWLAWAGPTVRDSTAVLLRRVRRMGARS